MDHNRYFGGASVRLVNRGAWKVDWRNLIERFQDTPGGDYTRFRSRGGAGRTRRDWTATATMEGIYAQSRATILIGATVDRRLNRELITGIGYEFWQYPDRSVGHIVITNITWQPGSKQ